MQSEFYPFQADEDRLYFTFNSISSNKTIRKIVLFTPLDENDLIYNLALLDLMPDGDWSDEAKSNNRDLEKVMATIIRCVFDFVSSHPDRSVYFKGNSPVKTRLYRIVITKQLLEIKKYFELYGVLDGEPEPFKTGTTYEAFILKPVV